MVVGGNGVSDAHVAKCIYFSSKEHACPEAFGMGRK